MDGEPESELTVRESKCIVEGIDLDLVLLLSYITIYLKLVML